MTIVAIVATLNTFGIVQIYSAKNIKSTMPNPECIKNEPIDHQQFDLNKVEAKKYIDQNGIKIKYSYFISYKTIEYLKKQGNGAGVIITPFPISGEFTMMASPSEKITCSEDDGDSYAYVIKTFCPDVCDEQR
jgi:hypothetical protein